MSYVPPPQGLAGCACRGCGRGALGADTPTVDPTQVRAIGAPTGTDPALYLRAQLNRYTIAGGAPPAAIPIAVNALPLTTTIDDTTAQRALFVLRRRAADANQTYNDAATKALIATYGAAWANPVGYVNANLPMVIDVVRLYGDKLGLPAAKGVPSIIGGFELTPERALLIGAAAIAAYTIFGGKRRRSR